MYPSVIEQLTEPDAAAKIVLSVEVTHFPAQHFPYRGHATTPLVEGLCRGSDAFRGIYPMKWAKMSERERDALVATKIFGWQPATCDGEMGEQPCSSDGWFCQKCGYEGYWGDGFEHEQIPPHYTTSLDTAWLVLRHVIKSKIGTKYTEAATTLRRWIVCDADIWGYDAEVAAELICKAALKVCGVEIDQSPAEPQSQTGTSSSA